MDNASMYLRTFATALATTTIATAAHATPEDYVPHLPVAIIDMELKEHGMQDGELVAYYGETIGRATLRVLGAPEADENGDEDDRSSVSGETPAAQRAMLDLLSRNLSEGTGALGDGYTTDPVRLFQIDIDGTDAFDGSLACGFIRRQQSEERAGDEEPMVLSDRVCLTQHQDNIIAVSITTPHRAKSMRQDMDQAQISFSGMLIGAILRDMEDAD